MLREAMRGTNALTAAADTTARPRQCYLANLAALYRADPDLAARVEALPFAQCPRPEPTRDGHATVRLVADDGRPVYAHSRYQPLEEARTLVQKQTEARRDKDDDAPPDEDLGNMCFLVSGIGLGYHLAEIERRYTRPLMIVAEDDLPLIKLALCITDLAEPLRERRLAFLTSDDKAGLHARLRPIVAPLLLGLHFVVAPHTQRYHAQFYTRISAAMRDFVTYGRLQMVSMVKNARITCKNTAFNLARYLAQPGVEALARRAAGYPAIVVAAGPSLARNIEQLAALQSRAVIIAAQTVLKTLLARGIQPHFVTSLDYHEISAQFFRGVADFGETILVAEPKVTWHVLDSFRGRTHVLHSGFVDDLLREAAPTRAALKAGSTVAHLAFYLAEHLGCDPVMLIGLDLSFTDGLYYPPGMPIERIWRPELGRFQTLEMKQWERIARHRVGLRVVPDIHGRNVYTDDQLFNYAEQFQTDFLETKTRVIHATEGGMRLQGLEQMTLHDAAAQFCTRTLPPNLLALDAAGPAADARPAACRALEQRIEELAEIRQIAEQTDALLQKLEPLIERPAEFNRLVLQVDELRTRMQRNGRTYNLVSQVSQLAELRRLQADRGINDEQRETPALARRRLKRDRDYVAALIDGCDYLQQMLPQALARVREQA